MDTSSDFKEKHRNIVLTRKTAPRCREIRRQKPLVISHAWPWINPLTPHFHPGFRRCCFSAAVCRRVGEDAGQLLLLTGQGMRKWLQTGSEATQPSVTAHTACKAGNKPTRSVAGAREPVKGLADCWWPGQSQEMLWHPLF